MTKKTQGGLLDGWATEKEMAAELHRSVRTLARMRKLKNGPPFTMLNAVPYYNIELGRQWLAAGGSAKSRRRSRAG